MGLVKASLLFDLSLTFSELLSVFFEILFQILDPSPLLLLFFCLYCLFLFFLIIWLFEENFIVSPLVQNCINSPTSVVLYGFNKLEGRTGSEHDIYMSGHLHFRLETKTTRRRPGH